MHTPIAPSITKAITYNRLHKYLKRFNSSVKAIPNELAQLIQIRPHLPIDTPPQRASIQNSLNETIRTRLEQLEDRRPEQAKLLFRRFVSRQNESIRDIARRNTGIDDPEDKTFKAEEARLNQLQKKAIVELVEIMRLEEVKAQQSKKHSMSHALGTRNYHQLVGTEAAEKELFHTLIHGANDILLLTGQGGIGKTSLADKLIRHAIDRFIFFDVIRLDIKGGSIPADLLCNLLHHKLFGGKFEATGRFSSVEKRLTATLKAFNYLVFIDGIEAKLTPILEKIRLFSGPTKFIVTSRMLPQAYRQLTHKPIVPLSLNAARTLFQTTLNQVQPENVQLEPDQFAPVFEKVGGNPLAIKLVAALTTQLTLPEILADLKSVEHPDIQQLYRRVYERIWGMLDPTGKQIMISLALFEKNGVSQELLLDMNSFGRPGLGLAPITASQLKANLDLLMRQSLVERSGSLWDDRYRYGLHNLTHTFLRTSIIQWPVGFQIAERYGHITPLPHIKQGLADWLARADQLDDGARPEPQVINDLESISEIIDWGLYWDETRPLAIELLQKIWFLLQRHGYFNSLEHTLSRAITYLQNSDQDQNIYALVRLKNRLGEVYRNTNRFIEAYELHTSTLNQAEAFGNNVLIAQTQCLLAEDLIHLNQSDEAVPLLKQALFTLEEVGGNNSWILAAATSLGRIYLMQKTFDQALEVFEGLLNNKDISIHAADKGKILHNAGLAAMGAGHAHKAQEALKRATRLLDGRSIEQARVLKDLANLHILNQDLSVAIEILQDSEKLIPAGVAQDRLVSSIKHRLGYAHLRLGNLVEAEKHMVQAVILLEKEGESWHLAEALGILGEVYLNSKQFTRAIEMYEHALQMSNTFPEGSTFEAEVRSELAQAKAGDRLRK